MESEITSIPCFWILWWMPPALAGTWQYFLSPFHWLMVLFDVSIWAGPAFHIIRFFFFFLPFPLFPDSPVWKLMQIHYLVSLQSPYPFEYLLCALLVWPIHWSLCSSLISDVLIEFNIICCVIIGCLFLNTIFNPL